MSEPQLRIRWKESLTHHLYNNYSLQKNGSVLTATLDSMHDARTEDKKYIFLKGKSKYLDKEGILVEMAINTIEYKSK